MESWHVDSRDRHYRVRARHYSLRHERLLKRLNAAERRLDASDEDVAWAAEQYSAEEAEQLLRAKLNKHHTAQTSKINDNLAALRQQKLEDAKVRTSQAARIQELEYAHSDDEMNTLKYELSKAKRKL